MSRHALLLALLLAAGGCGSAAAYLIPAGEVARLAQLPPAERGRQVRVVPQVAPTAGEADSPAVVAVDETPPVVVVTNVAVDVGVGGPGAHYRGERTSTRAAPASFREPAPAPRGAGWRGSPVTPAAPRHTSAPSVHHGGGGSHAGAAIGGAVALVAILAILATAAESAAENQQRETHARNFDGWVTVPADRPLHVVYEDGGERTIPLLALTPPDTVGIHSAYLSEADGSVVPVQGPLPVLAPMVPYPAPPPAPRQSPRRPLRGRLCSRRRRRRSVNSASVC